jgi:hypothetical protein
MTPGTAPPPPERTGQPEWRVFASAQRAADGTPRPPVRGDTRTRVFVAAVLALLLTGGVATACGSGSSTEAGSGVGDSASPPTTPSPSVSSSSSPASSASASTSAPTSASSTKPAVSSTSPTSASSTSTTRRRPAAKPARDGDIDGDGKTDQITLPRPGLLQVAYSAGDRDRVPFPSQDPEQRVLGAVDADSDGYAEVFVQVAAGAAARADAAFRRVGGRLRLMAVERAPEGLVRVGSLRNQGAWACRTSTAAIVKWSSTSEDGRSYSGDVRSYRFIDGRMALTSRVPFRNKTELPAAPGGETPGWGCGSLDLTLR